MSTTRSNKRTGRFVVRTIQAGIALLVVLASIAAALWVDGGTSKETLFVVWRTLSLVVVAAGTVIILIHDLVQWIRSLHPH